MAIRSAIPDFQLANPLYIGAAVNFYTVDASGVATTTLATLYAAPTGTTTAINPQTLDSEGKFAAPVYIEDAVVASVTGPNVSTHTTGVIRVARGTWRGDWVTARNYFAGDMLQDGVTNDIYVVPADYTSAASVAADVLAGDLEIVFSFTAINADAVTLAAAAAAAAASQAAAAASQTAAASSASSASSSATTATTQASNAATSAAAAVVSAATATNAARGLSMINGIIVESHSAGAATFALKTIASGGASDPSAGDPVLFMFQTSTGSWVLRSVTGALSLVVSSGSTLGVPATNTAFKPWIAAFDDAGTVRLGIINCLLTTAAVANSSLVTYDIYPLGRKPFASSTAEGGAGAADSAQVFYTGTAVTTKAYAVLGYVEYASGLATAIGTWDATPTWVPYGPGMKLPGDVLTTYRTATGAMTTGTTVIPQDDTIPTNAEGDVYLTKALTPTSAANLLEAKSQILGSISAAGGVVESTLIRDTTTITSNIIYSQGAASHAIVPLQHRVLANSVASTTFTIRGGGTSGTFTLNGLSATRYHGGALNSYLDVAEIVT